MNQIYKFSDPSSEFVHYILSKDIKKNLKYLDYLFQNSIKNPSKIPVNSPLVRYLTESQKEFPELTMELVFESEDKAEAEAQLVTLKGIKTEPKEEVVAEVPEEVVGEELVQEAVVAEVEEKEESAGEELVQEEVGVEEKVVAVPKKRGRKKKVETVVAF